MAGTKIEWADQVWNPVTGCTQISEGCANCYAKRMSQRLAGRYGYPEDEPFRVTFHPDKVEEPGKWKRPQRIFVCSMGDLFHESIPMFRIGQIFEVMLYHQRHTFMVLTKRPDRMADFYRWMRDKWTFDKFPPSNLWLGVTVENQARADERIPILLQIPAAVRFVSIEPMLGPVSFRWAKWHTYSREPGVINGHLDGMKGLSWVIVGGETGPGARMMESDWARSLREQCVSAGVPFFFKKHGDAWCKSFRASPKYRENGELDGRTWEQIPEGKA